MGIPILAIITAPASLLPVVVGLLRYSKLSLSMKVLLVFCIITSAEIAAEWVLAFHQINNLFLANTGVGIEVLFIASVYVIALDVKNVRIVIVVITALFMCLWVPDRIFLEVPGQINESMAIASRVVISAISIIALHTVARRTTGSLTDEALFWVTTANIRLSTGDIFVLGFSNELLANGISYFTAAWDINWSLDIIAYVLFSKGFFCKATTQS